jgi:O-antigen ligase
MPLIVLGLLEGVLGIVQHYLFGVESVHGTYVNRNHFAGLLAMSMPFALLAGVSVMRSQRPSRRTPARIGIVASLYFLAAGVMLTAVNLSLSRGGFTFALTSIFVMALVSLSVGRGGPRFRYWAVTAVIVLLVAGAFVYFPIDDLIVRFAELATTEDFTADTRAQIWRESTQIIAAYPLFGVGLGGFQSAFYRYQEVAPLNTVNYAHNDYLQLMTELGVVGFGVLVVLAVRVFRNAARAALSPLGTRRRYLGTACLGAFTALALHSLVDFNLYIPANLAVLSWIAGISEGLTYRLRGTRVGYTVPPVVEVLPCSQEVN